MLALRHCARPWNSQPTERIFFRAWASVCPSAVAASIAQVVPSNLGLYNRRKCVTLHMYERKGEFEIPFRNLFNLFEDVFSHDACKNLIRIVGIATSSMSYVQIKTMSYKGPYIMKDVGPTQETSSIRYGGIYGARWQGTFREDARRDRRPRRLRKSESLPAG